MVRQQPQLDLQRGEVHRCASSRPGNKRDEEEDQSDLVDEVDQVQLAAQVSDVSTAVLANGALSLDMIITRRIFDKIFPETEGSVFKFAQTPTADINVLEVAYFLAHVAYTTEDLAYSAERDGTMYDNNKYCQSSSAYKCASGASYYGRGPLFLRYNFNYYECAANAARVAKFKAVAKILNAKGVSKLTLSCADGALALVAAEETESTQLVANERLIAEDDATHATYAASYANVAVVGVAMTAMVIIAVIKRTARAAPSIENGDYALLTTFE
ncbi:Chitinase class I [Phytophthora infestans]|uniref:Chitinase class I n=1 Tax=Phytophthora infestans TaxID=4787 RepID=A0A833S9T7_PHYIN|nr:Chitinase class I [Phytophthora infestans]KAF4144611.1 Chitinase class I [Phytophthora infestans]KAF4146746.1 Chitinase class I [Phytophthora infestans]